MVVSGETGLKAGAKSGLRDVAVRKVLFICGIVSSLLYVATVLILGTRWGNYSWAAQNVSELGAIGSPTRSLFVPIMTLYNVLVIAFGLGIWGGNGRRRFLHSSAVCMILYAITGWVTGIFFPMPMREAIVAGAGSIMHPLGTAVSVLSFVLSVGFGAAALGRRFRLYSIATILAIIVFGVWTSTLVPRMEAGLPTPLMGLLERINIIGIMQWVAALAVCLLRKEKEPGSTHRQLG